MKKIWFLLPIIIVVLLSFSGNALLKGAAQAQSMPPEPPRPEMAIQDHDALSEDNLTLILDRLLPSTGASSHVVAATFPNRACHPPYDHHSSESSSKSSNSKNCGPLRCPPY